MTSVYLAGPMRGIRHFNFPAFNAAAKELRKAGYEVFNPAERDRKEGFDPIGLDLNGDEDLSAEGFSLRHALYADLEFVTLGADAVVLLPDWEGSRGVAAEVATAEALDLPVWTLAEALHPSRRPTPSTVLFKDEPVYDYTEVRSVSATGGEKGVKLERFDLIPPEALGAIARHYGLGSRKYADNNWRRGYDWSKSYAALQRHANLFWGGEDIDPETGSPHIIAVAWHAITLYTFLNEYPEYDDRYREEVLHDEAPSSKAS